MGAVLLGAAPDAAAMVDEGSWYSRVQWPHDGSPYESANFVVFSDAAGQEARRAVAELGEEVLAELVEEFGIDPERMFRFPGDERKIHIYVYQDRFPRDWGARAYYAGVVIWSPDHARRGTNRDRYRSTLKHELVHVVEALLRGRDTLFTPVSTRVHVWFCEGFAEAFRGETTPLTIRDLGHLEHLVERHGRFNPVSFVHDGQAMEWSEGKSALVGYEYQYPMYRLAVEYLVDPDGLGRPISDVLAVFTDQADGVDFTTAFANRMGIELAEYEEQFFSRMNGYLDPDVTVPYRRAALAWLAAVAVSLVILERTMVRGPTSTGRALATWFPVTVLLGPLGLLGYRLAHPGTTSRQRALVASMSRATWVVAGLTLVSTGVAVSGNGDVDPRPRNLAILFIYGWLIALSPVMIVRSRRSGWISALRSLSSESLHTVLVLAGVLIVFTPFDRSWWFSLDPRAPLAWIILPAGVIGGVVAAYPYLAWKLGRRGVRVKMSPISTAD